jgi:hypothetical protein
VSLAARPGGSSGGSAGSGTLRLPIRFVASQIGMIRDRIGRIPDEALRPALLAHAEALEAEALAAVERLGGLRHGADYVVVAEAA